MVAGKLREYGFEVTWQDMLFEMIRKVLSVPLEAGHPDFCLSRVGNQDRLNELGFYFPLKPITPKSLGALFSDAGMGKILRPFPERIERLEFAPVRGFMKGFMDLVFRFDGRFYLLDWKSNYLGPRVEDYGEAQLAEAMEKDFYMLQYHIYTLALDQYLRLRLAGYDYETHFGGVYYVFLRGVDPAKGAHFGVFRARPSGALIKEMAAQWIDRV